MKAQDLRQCIDLMRKEYYRNLKDAQNQKLSNKERDIAQGQVMGLYWALEILSPLTKPRYPSL